MNDTANQIQWPGESEAYRAARDELLAMEIDLRRRTEAVAAKRRNLPPGGEIKTDYVFQEGARDIADESAVREVRFSELFADGIDTLVVYSFMYGPSAKNPCPMCVSLLDSLNAQAEQLQESIGLAVVARSEIQRLREFGRERGWHRLRLLSSHDNDYNRDYRAENEKGNQLPMLHVFRKQGDGRILHFYASELFFANPEEGQHPRHVDAIWPLWNVLDLTPGGRPADWMPSLHRATHA
ncbi:MAG: DUF899 family protein [bacterium]|nr:DUF899 family protein [bacterium]